MNFVEKTHGLIVVLVIITWNDLADEIRPFETTGEFTHIPLSLLPFLLVLFD